MNNTILKNVLSFAFFIILLFGIVWLSGSSCSSKKEALARKELRDESTEKIDKLVSKWNVETQLLESIDKKLQRRQRVYTSELQDIIQKPNTPILVRLEISDIIKNEDNTYKLYCNSNDLIGPKIVFILNCTQVQYEYIISHPIKAFLLADEFAVVLQVLTIRSSIFLNPLNQTEQDIEERLFLPTIIGDCLDVTYVGGSLLRWGEYFFDTFFYKVENE